ncbi:MAG: hypothetical protein RIT27_621 [Pseudomonadota bacterium]|jgi:molybdenum cofactor cytidylyltransferase
MKIVGILLAAGLSRRFGSNKLLFSIENEPLVRRTARCLLDAGIAELNVVVGHQAAQISEILADLPLRCLFNPRYHDGRPHSLHVGWENVPADTDGVLICPADLPFLEIADVRTVIDAFIQIPANALIIPHFNQQRGHPIIISAAHRQAILNYLPRGGCRAFIADHPQFVHRLELNSPNIIADLDTPPDIL